MAGNLSEHIRGTKRKFVFDFDDIAHRKRTKHDDEGAEGAQESVDPEASELNDLMNLLDDLPEVPKLDKGQLEQVISQFHRSVLKNTQMRSLYADDAGKFMDSEIDLNEAITTLSEAATVPHLYPVLIKQGAMKDMKELLMHENTDLCISVIHLLRELTEPDSLDGTEDAIKAFALFEDMLETDAVSLLLHNLRRLEETKEDDFQAIYGILTIFDQFAAVDEDYCQEIVQKCDLFGELFFRMRTQTVLDENKLFCAEIMSVYVQTGSNKVREKWVEANGIEKCLRLLNEFQHHERLNSEEEEYVGNLFNTIISGLRLPIAKKKLAESKRALPVILGYVKDKKLFKQRALLMLNTAISYSPELCLRFVEEKGLKTIFAAFMKGRPKKRYKQDQRLIEEHLISIISSLFCNLSDVQYFRLLAKFAEKEFEKIDRLIELHGKYSTLVENSNMETNRRQELGNTDDETALQRLERLEAAGDMVLKHVDLVIGFVATAQNQEMRERVEQLLNQQDMNFDDIKKSLREFALESDDDGNEEARVKIRDVIYAIMKAL